MRGITELGTQRPGESDEADNLDDTDELDEPLVRPSTKVGPPRRRTRSTSSAKAQRWSRLLHVYLSMIAFAVVLFFALTGITLNHPEWTFGTSPTRTTKVGTLPSTAVRNGVVDWFTVSEYLRSKEDVRGSVSDKRADDLEGSIVFKGPAYEADARFRIADRSYTLTTESQGFVGMMNDLHKGRDTRSSWKWLIDVSGAFLAFVSFTGLSLQFFLRRRRRSAFVTAGVGGALMLVILLMAIQ